MKPLVSTIAKHPFLQGMAPAHLDTMATCGMPTEFAPGQVIFKEGDLANRFYLLLGGRVVLEARSKDGHPAIIQTLGEGDVVGWSWLFPPYYWHFGARALEKTSAVFFYGTRLRSRCEEDRDLGYEILKRTAAAVIARLEHTRNHWLNVPPPGSSGPELR